jgi:putative ABC transport system ATP-binding protein
MTGTPCLELRKVSRRFSSGATEVAAVRDASVSIAPGETVAVMGPSGSGKSTLLCLMGGLLRPDSGEVLVAGRSLAALPEREQCSLRRTRIAFVFQHFNLLKALSALENVELALYLAGVAPPAAREQARQALRVVGLEPRAHALPREMSGGEQQRVAVARALAPAPSVILADEPTANLDSTSGRSVIELLCSQARQRGAAVVIVSHDHRLRAAVDRVLWMEDGTLREFDDVHDENRTARAV